ncbi:transcription termination/antitermination protein NusG [Kaistia sp. MMO-174]|uniref:transcription termination/antitermination protein NusG n=1 Tax=Kaistia sp. MMO-174 TaxID=3081256 RepID=UPI0030167B05
MDQPNKNNGLVRSNLLLSSSQGWTGWTMAALAVLQEASTMTMASEASATAIEAAATPWFVLMTRPKVERQAARDIETLGLEAYWPRAVRFGGRSLRHRRVRQVECALFPGYVFVRGCNADDVVRVAREAPLVVGAICALDRPLRAPALAVDRLRKAEEAGHFDETRATAVQRRGPRGLKVGDAVEMTGGAFAWSKGRVQDLYVGRHYAKIEIRLFGGVHPIDVPIDLLSILL